ncbi:MAG: hypothetical protein IPI59_14500 [Sphingobacteriales bacterium]|nr:hypothetical protein [Sphingobacteriales bacterium]
MKRLTLFLCFLALIFSTSTFNPAMAQSKGKTKSKTSTGSNSNSSSSSSSSSGNKGKTVPKSGSSTNNSDDDNSDKNNKNSLFKLGQKTQSSELRKTKTRILGFEIGVGTWMGDLGTTYHDLEINTGRSVHMTLSPFTTQYRLSRKPAIYVGTGIQFQFNHYGFKNDIILTEEENSPLDKLTWSESAEDLKKKNLFQSFFTIPLQLQYESRPASLRHSFRIAGGGYLGFRTASSFRMKDDGGKDKIKDQFFTEDMRYGVSGRIGYGPINFGLRYQLSDTFKEGLGPDVKPFSVEFSIIRPF